MIALYGPPCCSSFCSNIFSLSLSLSSHTLTQQSRSLLSNSKAAHTLSLPASQLMQARQHEAHRRRPHHRPSCWTCVSELCFWSLEFILLNCIANTPHNRASSYVQAAPIGNSCVSLEQRSYSTQQRHTDALGVPMPRNSANSRTSLLHSQPSNSNLSARYALGFTGRDTEHRKQTGAGSFKSLFKGFKRRTPLPPAEQAHSMNHLRFLGEKSAQWHDFEFKLNTIAAERRRAAWIAAFRKLVFL